EERARYLREAVGHYKEALTVRTKDRYPVDWAITLNNLAGALTELPVRDAEERAGYVEQAVGYYKEALTVYTRDSYPHLHARTAANLGMLLFTSGAKADAKPYLESAWALSNFLPDQGKGLESFLKAYDDSTKEKPTPKRRRP
ncbi:MAG: hypothetical protein HYV08_10835, partial [Deltaproteobacteria bacterium]|nr:hypothetical protein [Deltaproteobacteria bacterium]